MSARRHVEGGVSVRERHTSSAVDGVLESSRLHPADVDAIARRVVELLCDEPPPAPPAPALIDAAEVARRLGRSRGWVYEHTDELGAVRLGDGARPRLAFDPDRVAAWATSCVTDRRSPAPEVAAPAAVPRRRRRAASGTGAPLLPIRGEEGRPWA